MSRAFSSLRDRCGRYIRGVNLIAKSSELLGEDADRATRLKGVSISPSSECSEDGRVALLLVVAGREVPWIGALLIDVFEERLRSNVMDGHTGR
jgi:hypothetical protein